VGFGTVFQKPDQRIAEAGSEMLSDKVSTTLPADQQPLRCQPLHSFP